MHRLLVDTASLEQENVTLPKDAAHHLSVLRPKPGEEIVLFDGKGRTRRYVVEGKSLRASGECATFAPPAVQVTIFACVTKGSRWDWTVEKAVELGVTRIVPVLSERCIVRLASGEREAKAERWRRVAEDAARQSDAVWLPEVLAPVDFPAVLELVKGCGCVFVGALTNPPPRPLLSAVQCESVQAQKSLGLFVGPEGDFTPAELEALLEIAVPASFGPTILRAETAAIFGLSVLMGAVHEIMVQYSPCKQSLYSS